MTLPVCNPCFYVVVYFLQQTKEKVKLLIQLADNLVEKGHAHVTELKRWVSTVDRRYRDFSLRMGKYQESLERSLGVSSEVKTLAVVTETRLWPSTFISDY